MTNYSTLQKDQLSKIGAHLRDNREQQGKSIEDISVQTYIRPQLLTAIESGDPSDLPQPIFVQGFIRRYAEALGLDGVNLSKQFPVHSIPDTPRPVPQPAAKPSQFSSAAMANPVITNPLMATGNRGNAGTRSTSSSPAAPSLSSHDVPKATPTNSSALSPAAIPLQSTTDAKLYEVASEPTLKAIESPSVNHQPAAIDSLTTPDPLLGSQPTQQPVIEDPVNRSDPRPPVAPAANRAAASNFPSTYIDPSDFQPKPEEAEAVATPTNFGPYILAGVLALVVLGAIALLTQMFGGTKPQPAQPQANAPDPAAEVATAPEPTPNPTPVSPTAESDSPVAVAVSLSDASWMKIQVDNAVIFEGMMPAGTEELWEGQNSIAVTAGNAGAVELSYNGSQPQALGAPGAVKEITITPDTPQPEPAATAPAASDAAAPAETTPPPQ